MFSSNLQSKVAVGGSLNGNAITYKTVIQDIKMKFKQTITKQIQIQQEDFEEKTLKYLNKNHYRITEKGPDYIIFIDDEFSERKSSRSDLFTRVGEGKLVFYTSVEQQTTAKLIYFTSITVPLSIMVLISAFGIYTETYMPIVLSSVFVILIISRVFYLKDNVFREILEG
ncbi:MAG: hypothetical protein V4594_13415 [Bacteroidota bacterium]